MSAVQSTAANRFVKGVPSDIYHAKVAGVYSNSAGKEFARSPMHYQWYLTAPPKPPTPELEFGTCFHVKVLEPEDFDRRYIVAPVFGDCRNKDNKAARDRWLEANVGRNAIAAEDLERVNRMADAVRRHPVACQILDGSPDPELTGYWTDPLSGLQCKMRADAFVPAAKVIGDIKTTIDASDDGFAKSIVNFRYAYQAALYTCGAAEILQDESVDFVWIAVEKTEPYAVSTFTLSREDRLRTIDNLRTEMLRFKKCVEMDEWPGYGLAIREIILPRWAK